METKKREFNNIQRASQVISFDGLEKGNCSFTDLDGVCEINNEYLIITDAKVEGNELPIGQRILMERFCDKNWVGAIAFVVEHDTTVDKIVRLTDCLVREARIRNGKWERYSQLKRKPLGMWLSELESRWNTGKLVDTYEHKFSYCGYKKQENE